MAVQLFRNESLEEGNYETTFPRDPNLSKRRRLAYLNPEAAPLTEKLFALHGFDAGGFEVTMNLFNDIRLDCVLTKARSTDTYNVFKGSVRDAGGEILESRVVMTVLNSMLSINIWVNDNEYQVANLGEDLYVIDEVNLESEFDCSSHDTNEVEEEPQESNPEEGPPINVTIGVLVIYESDVVTKASPTEDEQVLVGHIVQMVENLNEALSASLQGTGASVVIELLGPIKKDFSEMTNNNCAATDVLMNDTDVKRWRKEYGADLVSILRTGEKLGTSCADTLTSLKGNKNAAFSAVNYAQARLQHSFAHEIGHNFGCPHDKESADSNGVNADDNGIFWGYKWKHSNGKTYRTLMSYGAGTRILHFSNPNVLYKGEPTGTKTVFNAMAIAKTARAISKYSQEKSIDSSEADS